MHFCHEELRLILLVLGGGIPGLALLGAYIRSWLHRDDTCKHTSKK